MESINSQLTQELLQLYAIRAKQPDSQIREKSYQAGEVLIHQEGTPEEVFILLSGNVKVYHNTLKSNEYLVALEGPGEIIGEVEILTGEPYNCTVEALSQSKVGVMPKTAYQQWLQDEHDFALLVNRITCYRLQQFTKRAAAHLSYPLEFSVIIYLREQAHNRGSMNVDISKEEIANYLGTSVRSINRVLKNLQGKKVLKADKGNIHISSLDDLDRVMAAYSD